MRWFLLLILVSQPMLADIISAGVSPNQISQSILCGQVTIEQVRISKINDEPVNVDVKCTGSLCTYLEEVENFVLNVSYIDIALNINISEPGFYNAQMDFKFHNSAYIELVIPLKLKIYATDYSIKQLKIEDATVDDYDDAIYMLVRNTGNCNIQEYDVQVTSSKESANISINRMIYPGSVEKITISPIPITGKSVISMDHATNSIPIVTKKETNFFTVAAVIMGVVIIGIYALGTSR